MSSTLNVHRYFFIFYDRVQTTQKGIRKIKNDQCIMFTQKTKKIVGFTDNFHETLGD